MHNRDTKRAPNLQYIIDPGGGSEPDAFVVGIRTQMSF